jgi:hypothetical protein
MGKFIANVLLSAAILAASVVLAHHMRYAWAEAFVSNQTFSLYLGFLSGATALRLAFEVLFFGAVGMALAAAARTTRPILWAASWALLYSLCQAALFTHYGPIHAAWVYLDVAADLAGPVLGAAAGALVCVRLRGMAPNNSSKPTPLRGAA